MVRRALFLLAAAAMTAVGCVGPDEDPIATRASTSTTTASTTTTLAPTTTTLLRLFPEIAWSMPARFGLDGNDDGRIDVPNTAEYAHNLAPGSCSGGCPAGDPTFTVLLSAAGSRSEVGPIEQYRWEVRDAADEVASVVTAAAETEVRLAEGRHLVSLTVLAGGQAATATEVIEVNDFLIVAIGDSYASGEGNPETNAVDVSGLFPRAVGIWADGGTESVSESHRRAHRSTLAATPQVALELEDRTDRASVTMLFFPSSGASIDTGLIGPHPGVPYEQVSETELPAQIDEIATLLGCITTASGPRCDRTIDALTISIGGNDMGFGLVWGGLIAADPDLVFGQAYSFALNEILSVAEDGLRDLPAAYAVLDDSIRTRLQVDRVYLVAYPSPVGSGDFLCDEVAADLVPGLEADLNEITQAVDRILTPLDQVMAEAAAVHGWVYVDTHVDEFASHGYCGSDPYPAADYPGNPFPGRVVVPADPGIRWFRQADESTDIQGVPDSSFRPADLATRGTLHPNEYGHQSMRNALLAALAGG